MIKFKIFVKKIIKKYNVIFINKVDFELEQFIINYIMALNN